MKLEIDIPSIIYNDAKENRNYISVYRMEIVWKAIADGKPLEQEPKYCDRNICVSNEYNNIGCDECEVTKSQELKTDYIAHGTDGNFYKLTISNGKECEQEPCKKGKYLKSAIRISKNIPKEMVEKVFFDVQEKVRDKE